MTADGGLWNGRRVLVTGHTGFKGSWLTLWLRELGAVVGGASLDVPTRPALFELARLGDDGPSYLGDLADEHWIAGAVAELRPEVIFHLAAQSLVRRSYADPVGTFRANVLGTAHLLEAARRAETARVIVVATSDKCYENRETGRPYREDDPLGGVDPYSSSKACAELVTAAYRTSYFDAAGVAVATVRAGNVIGGGDWAEDRLLPDLMRAAVARTGIEIRNPDAVRPWQHVLDCLAGYLALADRLWSARSGAGAWNFGPEAADARPVRWIVETASAQWPGGIRWSIAPSPLHEAQRLTLDASKARVQLGWTPRWNVDQAVRRAVDWYARWNAGNDPVEISRADIRAYASTDT